MRSENMEAQPWLRSCDFQQRWERIRRYESQRRSPSHKELPSDVDQTTDRLDLATRRVRPAIVDCHDDAAAHVYRGDGQSAKRQRAMRSETVKNIARAGRGSRLAVFAGIGRGGLGALPTPAGTEQHRCGEHSKKRPLHNQRFLGHGGIND